MTRAMKDSGIEWIGQIPENWKITKYKYFARSGMGETILAENLYPVGIPVYSATQTDKIFGFVENANVSLTKGDLVIPARGCSIGCITYIKDIIATCTQTTIYSKVQYINSKYLYYFGIGLKEFWFKYDDTAIPQITVKQVQNNIILFPPLSEQQKIADYLDKRCEKIDTAIDNQKQIIEKLKEYKQSLITETVTKGLNPNVKLKDSGIEWIGSIPEHWKIRKLSRLFKERKCKNTGMKEHNVLSLSYGKIKKRDIENNMGLLPESFETYNIVIPGNIVLRLTDLQNDHRSLRTGLVKEVGIITSAYVTMERIMDIDEDYYHKLLHAFDIMKGFYNMGDGVRQSLKFNELNKLLLPQPPLSEQKEIAEYLDKKCNQIDAAIKQKEETISKLEEYKKSLIFECVTGKKEVA